MARPTYKDKTYLYVLPEQVPGTQVRCPVYARVTAIAGPRGQKTLKCQTIATDIAPTVEFEVPKNDCKLQIVTAREATTAPLRLWLRQFVFLAHEGRAFTGQVQAVDVEDEMFTVVCAHQRVKVPAETVEGISPVSAILLWEFDVALSLPEETRKLMKRARRTHARIEKRITDPAEGSRDLTVILAKIIPDGEEVPATIDLVSPATGKKTRVSVQHVVDHLFYSVDGREVPKDGSVGDQYWEDPRFGDRDDDELDASSDSEIEESDDYDSVLVRRSAKSGPSKVKLVNKPKEPLKRPRGVYSESGGQRSADIVVRTPHPSDSSPAGPETQFWRDGPLSRHYGPWGVEVDRPDVAGMDSALAHARRLASFGPAKRPRTEFNPNAIEVGLHGLITSEEYARAHPVQFMLRVRQNENLVFFKYPAVLRALFSFEFGPGRLSLLHFQPRDYDEISDWGEANGSILQDYSLTATLPTAVAEGPVGAALAASFEMLIHYATEYCRPFVAAFLLQGLSTLRILSARKLLVAAFAADVVQWIDSVFQQLHADLSDDLYGDDAAALHRRTRHLFDADSRELHRRLSAANQRQLAAVMASIPSLGGQIDAAPAAVKARQHRRESGMNRAEGHWQSPCRKHQRRVWCKTQQKHRRADKEVGANLVPTRGRWTMERRGPRCLVDQCVHRGVEGSNDEVAQAPVVSKLRGDREQSEAIHGDQTIQERCIKTVRESRQDEHRCRNVVISVRQ